MRVRFSHASVASPRDRLEAVAVLEAAARERQPAAPRSVRKPWLQERLALRRVGARVEVVERAGAEVARAAARGSRRRAGSRAACPAPRRRAARAGTSRARRRGAGSRSSRSARRRRGRRAGGSNQSTNSPRRRSLNVNVRWSDQLVSAAATPLHASSRTPSHPRRRIRRPRARCPAAPSVGGPSAPSAAADRRTRPRSDGIAAGARR